MADRLAAARDYVARKPTDRFGLFALAMELRKTGQWADCFATFDRLVEHHPDYGAGWFHYGMSKKESGDVAGALTALRSGIDASRRSSDTHTLSELESAIDELEGL